MNPIEKRKIFNLIQFLFNSYLSENHKNLLITKYNSYDNFDSAINDIAIDIYHVYSKEEEKLNFYLGYLSEKYLDNKELELIKKEILDKLELNLEYGDCSLEENHHRLVKALLFVCRELNKRNIDYYVVGSVPIYIKLNLGFSRYHTDIDIAINTKDINKLEDVFLACDYKFFDNRFNSQKFFDYNEKRARGGHELIAQDKSSSFSIGFYEFERLDNGGIIKKDYFSEVVEDRIFNRVCKYFYSKEFVDLYYSKDKLQYLDVEFRYCNVEAMYILKQKNYNNIGRNKDLFDIDLIEKNYELDQEKIKLMNNLISEYASYTIEDI